jgi:hypothetical protein
VSPAFLAAARWALYAETLAPEVRVPEADPRTLTPTVRIALAQARLNASKIRTALFPPDEEA